MGSTRAGKGADWHITRALRTVGAVTGPNQRAWVRGDSAFATAKNIHAAIKAGAWFGFTIPAWPTVTKAISQIPDSALTGIQYPNQVRDEETGEWTSEPEVAETEFTAFVSKKADQQANCQLVVRRAKRLGERRPGEGELCTAYRRYAFITNTTLSAVGADAFHRGHAIIEQVIAEHTAEPPAHLPSGKLSANAAWLTFAVMAITISRAIAAAAGERHPPMRSVCLVDVVSHQLVIVETATVGHEKHRSDDERMQWSAHLAFGVARLSSHRHPTTATLCCALKCDTEEE